MIPRKELTIQELYDLMNRYWDMEQYGSFVMDYRNEMSDELCIFLPLTKSHMVLVSTGEEGIFHKKYILSLSIVETPSGIEDTIKRTAPSAIPIFGAIKIGKIISIEKKRRFLAEEKLEEYSAEMRKILEGAGYLTPGTT